MDVTIDSMLSIVATQEQINIIASDNTYPNPQYQQAVNMSRSTYGMDKIISTYTTASKLTINVPRGYYQQLPEHQLIDNRIISPANIPPLNDIILRNYQQKAVSEMLRHDQGIIQSGTGSGKTIIGLELIHQRQNKSLILTHSKELMRQWKSEIKKLLGINCGIIAGSKKDQDIITICMLQTLNKRPELLLELSNNYGLVLVDECHHIPSKTFSKVINQLACKFRYGLTATPHRRDGLHQLINRHIGEVEAFISDDEIAKEGGVVPITIKLFNTNKMYMVNTWNEYIEQIINDVGRNQHIIELSKGAIEKNISTLILTDRVIHAETLSQMTNFKHLLLHGQLPASDRKERMNVISDYCLTIGTTALLGEGLDVSNWTALILATPISSKVRLLQAIGRVCRVHKGKAQGYVADLVDNCGFSQSSYRKRLKIYQEKGYTIAGPNLL